MNYWTLINKYRIEEAKELLINSPEDSILKIAYTVGYNSKTTFNTTFKKIVGITPSEFRNDNT